MLKWRARARVIGYLLKRLKKQGAAIFQIAEGLGGDLESALS